MKITERNGLFVIGAALALAGFVRLSACGFAKPACAVVDVLDKSCDVFQIRYQGPDGGAVVEAVPAKDVQRLAKEHRRKRLDRDD